MKIDERHDDLSQKIFKMGHALSKEGINKDDYVITSVGNFMILISGLIYDEKDINLFSELCAMFSAKKVMEAKDSQVFNDLRDMDEDEIIKMYEKMKEDMTNPTENDLGFDLNDTEDEDDEDL
jgi:hypothetical protein